MERTENGKSCTTYIVYPQSEIAVFNIHSIIVDVFTQYPT